MRVGKELKWLITQINKDEHYKEIFMSQEIIAHANEILKINDYGSYTIPTDKLYPFQWNWDSCLTALGISHTNEDRAWTEIEELFSHQWKDGMVPHIIFHQPSKDYFPGTEVWQAGSTSGITQPPIAGFVVNRLYKNAKNKSMAKKRALKLLPLIAAWHNWFFSYRDPDKSGLVAIIHPWESGRDNSSDWDKALQRVPSSDSSTNSRRDTQVVNPKHRPTNEEYDKYIYLVELFRNNNWDNEILHEISPFQIVDPGFNSLLLRSCYDLGSLAKELGYSEISANSFCQFEKGMNALETLWSNSDSRYSVFDRKEKTLVKSSSIGGLLPIFAPIPKSRAEAIISNILEIEKNCNYLLPSHDPMDDKFDSLRYWRGPVWLIMNYFMASGVRQFNNKELSDRIVSDSISLIKEKGFAEYFDPKSGKPCGGDSFSWTAAMTIELLLGEL